MRGREVAAQGSDSSRIKILGAAQDKIVNTQAGKKHYQRIFSGLRHEVIPGSCHAMHMDGNTYQGVMTNVIQHLNPYDPPSLLSLYTSEV